MNNLRTVGLALVTLAIGVGGDSVVAQRTTFNPSVSVGVTYSDDIGYAGVEDASDSAARVALDLPVERQWQTGSMRFSYRPSYSKQTDIDALDRDEHRLGFQVRDELSPRSSVSFAIGFSRTQQQSTIDRDIEDPGETDLFLTQRTERDLAEARVSYARTASERWNWGASVNWTERQFERIDDFNDSAPGAEVEDRTSYGGSFRFGRSLSRTSTLGLVFNHDTTELDLGGDEDSDSVSLSYRRDVGRNMQIGFSFGGFRSTGEASDGTDGDDERTGARGGFNLNRQYRSVSLGLNLSHRPSSGGDLSGTSTDTRVGLTLSGSGSETWDWSLSPRYGRRDPADPSLETRDAIAFNASVERRVEGVIGVRLDGGWADQSDDDSQSVDVGISLVWYPRGRRASGGS